MKVYFISGLGADRTVFKNIELPPHCHPVHLDWIPPLESESLESYALRMAGSINSKEAFSLIGLSMGGMITMEISRHFRPVHTILISSISSSRHLPPYYRVLGALQMHRFLPISLFQRAAAVKRLFSSEAPEDKIILKGMIQRANADFIRWAFGAILNWKSPEPADTFFHIHGTRDEILPKRFTRPTHVISRAGHLMVLNRSKEINAILAGILGGASAEPIL